MFIELIRLLTMFIDSSDVHLTHPMFIELIRYIYIHTHTHAHYVYEYHSSGEPVPAGQAAALHLEDGGGLYGIL